MKKTTSASVIRYINDTTAQVTKAFEKKACIFGTEEFKLWREYKKEFPKAKMVTKKIKKNEDQKRRRNKTFENMEAFIKTQPDAKALEEEFKRWREYKALFPKAQMVTKSIKKNPNQKTRRNMTFENMEAYIATQPDAKALKKRVRDYQAALPDPEVPLPVRSVLV